MVRKIEKKNGMTAINLKMKKVIHSKFKRACRGVGSMQGVLSAFINSFIENPRMFKIKMEIVNMELSSLKIEAKGDKYNVTKHQGFEVREVVRAGKPLGVWHVKMTGEAGNDEFIKNFQEKIPGCKIDLIDPSGEMDLDYPIYLATKDQLQIEGMGEFFQNIQFN